MIFLNISTSFFAQISDYSQAKSILLNLNDDNLIEPSKKVLQYLDLNLLEAEDQIDEQNGLPPRFGFPKDVDYNLQNSGVWKVLSNGDRIWRLKIICQDALSI
ncbi:MAG: hypothetical protein CVU03_12915 [Bacteroidetes bacterium HGW-Bacteroidetes-2]|nr:MAG: hypothetical protein CVU03_12915 [Bacteroidetes bacterium HGW-Bacteroidetes-2]